MKKYLAFFVLAGILIGIYRSKPDVKNLILEKKSVVSSLQHNISEKISSQAETKQPENIEQIEIELVYYAEKSFDELSPEEINRFNFLNLQRAIILKNQIFAKAKSKGYL